MLDAARRSSLVSSIKLIEVYVITIWRMESSNGRTSRELTFWPVRRGLDDEDA
jgi:hypothetical protein